MRSTPALILATALAVASASRAETYVVEADGSGDYPNLSEALLAALSGDVIQLGEGVFGPETTGDELPWDVPDGVSIIGEGAGVTFLDGGYGEELMMIRWADVAGAKIEALTLQGGESPRDGDPDVLYVWQSMATLVDVHIHKNGDPDIPDMPWNLDMWIDVRSSSLTLEHVRISDNHANNRGVTCTDSTIVADDLYLTENDAYYSVLDLREGCDGSLNRVLVRWNQVENCDGAVVAAGAVTASNVEALANDAGPCRLWQGAELVHATVAGNDGTGFFPLVEVDRLGHSIVAFNGGAVALTGEQRAVFNDVYGNEPADWEGVDPTGSDGNVAVDPGFVAGPESGQEPDLYLDVDSPLIDAGGDELTSDEDRHGEVRPLDGDGDGVALPDLGAVEVPEDYYDPGDDDDAGDDDDGDDDGCECSAGPPGSAAAAPLAVLFAALVLRRRRLG